MLKYFFKRLLRGCISVVVAISVTMVILFVWMDKTQIFAEFFSLDSIVLLGILLLKHVGDGIGPCADQHVFLGLLLIRIYAHLLPSQLYHRFAPAFELSNGLTGNQHGTVKIIN